MPAAPTVALQLNRYEADHVVDALWQLEDRMRRDGLDGSDLRLVEVIELRARAEKLRRRPGHRPGCADTRPPDGPAA